MNDYNIENDVELHELVEAIAELLADGLIGVYFDEDLQESVYYSKELLH